MNFWEKQFGAIRRRKDRALLSAMEREIANEEKLRADPSYLADVAKMKIRDEETERARIARAFGRPA
jgi:hypothetical protein